MKSSIRKTSADDRLAQIRQIITQKQPLSIPALARQFAVSQMTIRRDLDKLARGGQVKRTHGGAVVSERMAFEFDFHTRRQANRRRKKTIAQKALSLIQPGCRIILDTGTTTLELAELLKDASDLTVITPSLAVASVLQFAKSVETILLGGTIRKGSPDLAGFVTEKNLDLFSVDLAFIGADGINLDGAVYNADMRIAKTDQKICSKSRQTYVLADSSKIGKTALIVNGYLKDMTGIITDNGIKPEHRKKLEKAGANIILVEI